MSAESVKRPASEASKQQETIRAVLSDVYDPEIPVLSVLDLGIVRAIAPDAETPEVVITPTYSGCPAMDTIENDVRRALDAAGFGHVRVRVTLSPPWTTDWLSDAGREKLRAYGIAPPVTGGDRRSLIGAPTVACPRCGAKRTEKLSEFGSTACKALYRCCECREPFDYFKCL